MISRFWFRDRTWAHGLDTECGYRIAGVGWWWSSTAMNEGESTGYTHALGINFCSVEIRTRRGLDIKYWKSNHSNRIQSENNKSSSSVIKTKVRRSSVIWEINRFIFIHSELLFSQYNYNSAIQNVFPCLTFLDYISITSVVSLFSSKYIV